MVALGSLLGRKLGVRPKRHDNWLVIPNLWGVVVGRPSTKKTPALSDALFPLRHLEHEAQKQYESDLIAFQAAERVEQIQQKEREKRAAVLIKGGDEMEAQALLEKGFEEAPSSPSRRRYIVNDATVEKLGEILSENPSGLLQYRDELTGWLNIMEKEDRGQDRAFYLEAWTGLGSFTYDRIKRGTVDIASVTVSVLGTIQPAKLLPYLAAQKSGKGDDGFIERFQLTVYPDGGQFKHIDRCPDEAAFQDTLDVFNKIESLAYSSDDIAYVNFTEEAQAIFDAWYKNLFLRLREDDLSPQLESHLSKYPSLMASLALIINVVEAGPNAAISSDAANRAISWCTYLETHAKRVYGLTSDPAFAALKLLDRLPTLHSPFVIGDINRKQWSGLTKTDDIHSALGLLCSHGYLVKEIVETSTKPKTLYHINPHVKED